MVFLGTASHPLTPWKMQVYNSVWPLRVISWVYKIDAVLLWFHHPIRAGIKWWFIWIWICLIWSIFDGYVHNWSKNMNTHVYVYIWCKYKYGVYTYIYIFKFSMSPYIRYCHCWDLKIKMEGKILSRASCEAVCETWMCSGDWPLLQRYVWNY